MKSFADYSIKEIKTASEVSATQKYFGFATVQSYKGMESNYVLITDIEDLSSEVAKSLMYVGMSRVGSWNQIAFFSPRGETFIKNKVAKELIANMK